MSHNRFSIDQHISLYFSQGLTQAEIALCLSVRDNTQISTRNLRRRLARLKLYGQSHFSDLDEPNLCDHKPHTRFQSRDGS